MEAIGQKGVLSSTDEVIISDELDVNSGEMVEERMFDVTLDEILAEHPLDESLLEGLLEEDSLTASLASSILTQNQANPEFVEDIFGPADLSTIPAEVLDDNLWTEETHTTRSKVLNKSEPFTQELIEVLDPRVVSDENTFQKLPSQGVAETGLQSILRESDLENHCCKQYFIRQSLRKKVLNFRRMIYSLSCRKIKICQFSRKKILNIPCCKKYYIR